MYNDIKLQNVMLFCTESKDIPKFGIWEDNSYAQYQKSKFWSGADT